MKQKFLIGVIVIAIVGYISYPTINSLKEEYYARKAVEEKFNNYKDNKNNASNITIDEDNDMIDEEQIQTEQTDEILNIGEENILTQENTEKEESKTSSSSSSSNTSTSNKISSSSLNTNKKPSSSTEDTNEKPTTPTYVKLTLMNTSSNDNIKVSQNGNNFTLSGTMEKKEPTKKFKSGSYVKLKITAPEIYKTEVLEKAKVTLLYNNRTYTQAIDKFLESTSSKTKSYFYLEQEFMNGMTIYIVVYWGNGKEIKHKFVFNINVIDNEEEKTDNNTENNTENSTDNNNDNNTENNTESSTDNNTNNNIDNNNCENNNITENDNESNSEENNQGNVL